MVNRHKNARTSQTVSEQRVRHVPWLELLLGISIVALLIQLLFPEACLRLVPLTVFMLGYLDVRSWTWRSYAVVCTMMIIGLVLIRSWQNA